MNWKTLPGKDRSFTGALIASIILAGGLLIFLAITPGEEERFTEFYILGPGGYTDHYPDTLIVDVSATLIMGVVNHENATVDYAVEARLDSSPDALTLTTDGERATATSASVFELSNIADEAEWEHLITITPLMAGDEQKLEFLLFSSLPRSSCVLRAPLSGDGYVSLQLDEGCGETRVRIRATQTRAAECRIEAWKNSSLVDEQTRTVDAGEDEQFTFHHPPGKTLFKIYDGNNLVLDDTGAQLTLHLWVDVVG